MNRSFACLLALFVGLLSVLAPRNAHAQMEAIPDEIVLGFTPAENAEALRASANDLAAELSSRIHLPVKAFVALDYAALVEAMHSGQVHFGWLMPASLVLAEQRFHAEILLTQIRKGKPTYYSAIVVRDGDPATTVADLKGRSIAWVDPTSTSGYIIPRYLMIKQGLDPNGMFRQQFFAGGHDAAVIAVQSGQADAAAVWADPPEEGTGAWTRYLKDRPGPRLHPILYSPAVPSDAVAVNPEFSSQHPRLVNSVKEALIAIGNDPTSREVLKKLNATDGFVKADPGAYGLVREAFAASRASRRKVTFEHPWAVGIFFGLCALAVLLALPVWGRIPRARGYVGWLLFASAFVWSLTSAQLSFSRLLQGRAAMVAFLRGMFPPDQTVVPIVIEETINTLQLALLGTVFAIPLALVLGFLAAENVMRSALVRGIVRFFLNFNRSVDTLILALILVSAVGLGPLPGVLALAIHSVGALGKLFYEAIETLDQGPVEAMRSVGATPIQAVRWGIWPQFAPHFISIVLFRFELNVRVSTVLGLVGAGGIGFLLITYMRGAEYAKVTAVVGAIVALVMALDAVSTRLRKRVT